MRRLSVAAAALLALAGCGDRDRLTREPVPDLCPALCFEPCPGTKVDADGTVVALAPRWEPPDPEAPDAWDTYPLQVTGPLLQREAACEVRRGVCAECLLRLRREGVTR